MCHDIFSDSEMQEVREFIEVSEYGLALDTLIDIIKEEKKTITPDMRTSINEIAECMKMEVKID